jgi:hypothetical protein
VVFYSARPVQRVRQVVLDVVVLLGCVLAVVIGTTVSGAISGIAAIGTRVNRDGSAFQEQLGKAASALGKVPFAGDAVSRPLREASERAGAVAAAGTEQHDATVRLAHLVGAGVAVVLVVALLLVWLHFRGGFVRTATATARLGRQPAGTELLAVRALTTRSEVTRLGADVVERWRQGDPATVRALADLERRASGLPSAARAD